MPTFQKENSSEDGEVGTDPKANWENQLDMVTHSAWSLRKIQAFWLVPTSPNLVACVDNDLIC